MKLNYTIGERKSSSLGKTLLTLTAGIAIGYGTHAFTNTNEGYTINDGYITKENHQPRKITTENGIIQVGSLKEQVNDLLYQNPAVIKQTVEELYAQYAKE